MMCQYHRQGFWKGLLASLARACHLPDRVGGLFVQRTRQGNQCFSSVIMRFVSGQRDVRLDTAEKICAELDLVLVPRECLVKPTSEPSISGCFRRTRGRHLAPKPLASWLRPQPDRPGPRPGYRKRHCRRRHGSGRSAGLPASARRPAREVFGAFTFAAMSVSMKPA